MWHRGVVACLAVGTSMLAGCVGCADDPSAAKQTTGSAQAASSAPGGSKDKNSVDQRPPPMAQPVPLWRDGEVVKQVDAASASLHGYEVMDIGETWVPYLFTEGEDPEGNPATNDYRETYLKLARGEFPDNHHGERARQDKYLELYGIMPTLSVLREHFHKTKQRECLDDLDLEPLRNFDGYIVYQGNDYARRMARDFRYLRHMAERVMKSQGVSSAEEIDLSGLSRRARGRIIRYKRRKPQVEAVRAAQARLECEGYFEGKGNYTRGALDWATHEALAEFERRHRIYAWGVVGGETLEMLRNSAMEAERQGVLRVLTERAIHAAGVIEDGSTSTLHNGEPRTFEGADGKSHPIPDLEAQLRQALIDAFGLQTPESTLAWLEGLGELPPKKVRLVAFEAPPLPEYYDGDMKLTMIYDRGDVWYEFPYDSEGNEKPQPVNRRPRITVVTKYNGQNIPLARFGTTIGGWRGEYIDGEMWWAYKESPVGTRVWHRIVAAPVWLPPKSTPPEVILERNEDRKRGEPEYEVDYHTTGPSYASAYGLVAAYHLKFHERPDGTIIFGKDEGIRTHGSVDYMSIMRRFSHGCHRLHNHIAVRLMSFVLAHRPHRRVGQQPVRFKKEIEHEDETYLMDIDKGGYVFELEEPLKVTVLEGRIRGRRKEPIETLVPPFDEDMGAYVLPDGGAVELKGAKLKSVPLPVDAGTGIDAGLAAHPPSSH